MEQPDPHILEKLLVLQNEQDEIAHKAMELTASEPQEVPTTLDDFAKELSLETEDLKQFVIQRKLMNDILEKQNKRFV